MSTPEGAAIVPAAVRGILWMIAGVVIFVFMGWSVRALAPIPASELVLFRSFVGLFLVIPFLGVPVAKLMRPRRLGLFSFRAVLSYVAMLAWFYGLQNLALADAVALHFTLPLFTTLFAILFFGEPVGIRRWVATAVGFAGALIVIRPGFAEVNTAAVLVLGSAALYAAANMTIKMLSESEHPMVVVFWMHLLTLPMGLVGALPYWIWPGWDDAPWILVLAATGSAAHYCVTRSLSLADASVVFPFDYLRMPLMALVGYLAYGETQVVWTWVGAVIIAGASIYIARREARAKRTSANSKRREK
jgi:drug/metabolite transporter (DMT)-like permease